MTRRPYLAILALALAACSRTTQTTAGSTEVSPPGAATSTALPKFEVLSYAEHSLGKGSEARAVSYIQIKTERGQTLFGAGTDTNIDGSATSSWSP